MALILCIVALGMEATATVKFSEHIVREMAPVLYIVAVDMEAEATL